MYIYISFYILMDLYRYLSEGGMEDPKFYILKKPIPNIPEIEWDSTHASYYAQLKDWFYSDIPVDEKQMLFQGEILATSSTNDDKSILLNYNCCLSVCPLLGNAHWNVNWNCPGNVVSTVILG